MQKKIASLLFIALLLPFLVPAQSREMGIMVGVMGYKGDLNPVMYNSKTFQPAIGIVYRRAYSNHWAFKAGFNYGHVQADDADAKDDYSKNRNLMFRSPIVELTGQFEFNFFPYQTSNSYTKASPYIFVGLTAFRFNPKALYDGEWVALQPLGTEGQGTNANGKKPYSRTSAAFTYGGGFKFKLGRRFGVVLETGIRKTYTDYLDDVSKVYADPKLIRFEYGKKAAELSDRSFDQAPGGNIGRQRGNSRTRDFYMFTGVQITYTLSRKYMDSCRPFRIKLW